MSNLLKIESVEIPKLPSKTARVNRKYEEGLNKVQQDLKNIRDRQAQAKVNIEGYKEELAVTGVDVAVVQDDLKRKELLDRRETIREKIEEEELYLNLDIQAYKQRIIEEQNLDELRYNAGREYRTISLAVKEYRDALKKEAERSSKLAEAMAERDNEYLELLRRHKLLTGKDYVRWEGPRE